MSTNNKKNVCDTCVLLVDYTDIKITELGRFKPNPQILWDMQGAEAVPAITSQRKKSSNGNITLSCS